LNPNPLKPWLPDIERRLLAQKLAPHRRDEGEGGEFSWQK